jgi:hypothetical protein
MGTVSGPFLIIRNLSAVFDDDTREEFPPDLRNEEEDATTLVFFLNRVDSLDSVAVFEDIEAAEDDAVLNMTNDVLFSSSISLLNFFSSSSLSLSIYISCELSLFLFF